MLPVGVEPLGALAVVRLAAAERVLLGHEPLDPRGNALVAHELILTTAPRADTIGLVADLEAVVADVANELATWPGVRIGRRGYRD
jgi:hypothetical protein